MGKQSDEHGLRERVECEREMVKNRVTCSAKTCLRSNLAITKRRRVDDSERFSSGVQITARQSIFLD